MDEVSAALVAIGVVLIAVFVPTTFLTGITGEFYRQFAVTIASSTVISLLLSLTLSPALAALLLKPRSDHRAETGVMGSLHRAGDRFNDAFGRLSEWYAGFTRRITQAPKRALTVYGGLVALTVGASSGRRRPASSRRRTRAMRWPRSSFRPEARSNAPTRC